MLKYSVFFYGDKSICSFDQLKVASDWSYLKIFVWLQHLIKINLEYYENNFELFLDYFTKGGIFQNLSTMRYVKHNVLFKPLISLFRDTLKRYLYVEVKCNAVSSTTNPKFDFDIFYLLQTRPIKDIPHCKIGSPNLKSCGKTLQLTSK